MPEQTRHASLDMLRGFAILGILVMNIQAFAMPWPAYANPHAFGSMEGIHGWVYYLSHLFFDGKVYSLFAMMFGAGLALLAERSLQADRSASGRHYRRMLFLGVIGLLHGFFIWYGDILFIYAVCGSVAWLFLRRRTTTLLVVGVLLLLIPVLISLVLGWSMAHWPDELLVEMAQWWGPTSPAIAEDLAAYTGAYSDQLPVRAEVYLSIISWSMGLHVFWHATGLMLLGMALYRLGMMTADWSRRAYLLTLLLGLGLGLALALWGLLQIEAQNWRFPWTKFVGRQYNNTGAPLVALAYLSMIMLLYQTGRARLVQKGLQAVGQTALSNYLLQSLVCTLIFYGHGLGLFGEVSRGWQAAIVPCIWFAQIGLSLWWLRHFRQGPVEWLGRCFSRLEAPAFRRQSESRL